MPPVLENKIISSSVELCHTLEYLFKKKTNMDCVRYQIFKMARTKRAKPHITIQFGSRGYAVKKFQ